MNMWSRNYSPFLSSPSVLSGVLLHDLKVYGIFHANYNCKKSLKICKSKHRQHNGEIKIDNRTNNKLQNITHKP
jgi:hypothetical protein